MRITVTSVHVDYRLLPKVNVNLEWAQRTRPAPKSTKGEPFGSHMIGGNYPVNMWEIPTTIGWTIGGRMHQKSSARGKSPI